MEQEHFLSGYCRRTDSSRTVTVITENGALTEIDCDYVNCPHNPGCPIAKSVRQLNE